MLTSDWDMLCEVGGHRGGGRQEAVGTSGYNYGGCCGCTSKTAGRWGVTLVCSGPAGPLCWLDSRIPQTAGAVTIVRI